ncbi:hypothetical protein KJA15_01035 [Patescibacteria group bacterium]|nr:hypothetical protein [Patescibacteria group bacterium]
MVQDLYTITYQALLDLWKGVLSFIPNLLAAIVVLIIGWLIAEAIGRLIARILIQLRLNKLFEKADWREALEKADIKVNPAEFIGAICKWILVIVVLSITVEILGLKTFAILLNELVAWLPNLVVAIVIFVVAVIVADLLNKIIRASVKKIGVKYAGFLGMAVRWAIYIFAGLAILLQLGVAPSLINALVMSFLGMIALALGLAFGLGGKEAAARLIEDLREKISEQ